MNKLFLSLLTGSLLFSACSKNEFLPPVEPVAPCKVQTENPTGRSYSASSIINYTCTDKHCGLFSLSTNNYWIYEDSLFTNGVFQKVQYDTLRFTSTKKSVTDGLVWWTANKFVGLPTTIYSNDSAFFTLSDRMFAPDIVDAKKDFILPAGDSVKYLASFEDVAASGRSVRLHEPYYTPAATFSNCIYFEKNARNFRKDQVYFKEGIGVLKYIQEKAAPGDKNIKLQQVSTLVYMHIE